MGRYESSKDSCYRGSCIVLTTKHAKSIAIAPPFIEKLGASVLEYVVDTDILGTFTGEVEREGNALDCARKKCEWSLNILGDKVEFAIASEGSFGKHPFIPYTPCDQEILYFIDRKRDFHLHLSHMSENTNYSTESILTFDQLEIFAEKAMFPSHALILRPNNRETKKPIFKGLNTWQALKDAFIECSNYANEGIVWAETDMRAHFNPTRMNVIADLATKLSDRLNTYCPKCDYPGWGTIRCEKGLPCICCGLETEMVKSQVFGCTKCDYEEMSESPEIRKKADPVNCQYCNP